MPRDLYSKTSLARGTAGEPAKVVPFVRRGTGSIRQPESRDKLKCLWISRDIPFPQDAGDRIYSANMADASALAGVQVSFIGYGAAVPGNLPGAWADQSMIATHVLAGHKRGKLNALFSHLPIAAAIHATPEYRAVLARQLAEDWDFLVIDSYGSGWALDACLAARERARNTGGKVPTIVYFSHNHEESIWRSMAAQGQASLPKRLALWQNYLKVRALERRLVARADMVSAITEEDAQTYTQQAAGKPTVTLTPGYSGWSVPERTIDASTPRRVVLVGSFRWVVKQENLRRFLELADARFKQHDICFDVIGDVPQALLDELRPTLQATQFHGFVDDIAPYFATARMAVVPEVIGGGFKLKYLDYLFARVPIATIGEAAAGLPQAIRDNMLCCDDLAQLIDVIIATIDQHEHLNTLQQQAFTAAHSLFDWKDRGAALRRAVESLQTGSKPVTHLSPGSIAKLPRALPEAWEPRP
ncbi:MAG: hypothetical protein JWL63_878 [Rhodocyclales bacterium]|nr:hypothetical protein [Rhodocyclales bacterium]